MKKIILAVIVTATILLGGEYAFYRVSNSILLSAQDQEAIGAYIKNYGMSAFTAGVATCKNST